MKLPEIRLGSGENFREEIPQRAFINAQIIQLAEQSGSLDVQVKRVCDTYGIANYRVTNPAHAVALLYCLIVVPHELWQSPRLFERLRVLRPQQFFNIRVASHTSEHDSVDSLIRHLRNAVAHADFSVSSDGSFTFRDHRNRDTVSRFEAEISSENLSKFLSCIGAEMANARAAQKVCS